MVFRKSLVVIPFRNGNSATANRLQGGIILGVSRNSLQKRK